MPRLWIQPRIGHALVLAGVAGGFALSLAFPIAWVLTAQATQFILTLGGVPSLLILPPNDPTLVVPTADGDVAFFSILVECSGLITVAIFGMILAATMGLLQGPLWFKGIWAGVGTGVGIFWNINRLVLIASSTHYVGLGAFEFVHFLFAPMVDFLWMVVVWSVGMSLMGRWAPEASS
ncbi:MAG: exosortase/archaeosortase family protein [Thermoplasmata archaeon]